MTLPAIMSIGYPGHRMYVEFKPDVVVFITDNGKHSMTYRVFRDFIVAVNEVMEFLPLPTPEEDEAYLANLVLGDRAEASERRRAAIEAAKQQSIEDWLSRQARDATKNLPDNEV